MSTRKTVAVVLALAAVALLALWGDPFALQLAGYLPMLVIGWVSGSEKVPPASEIFGQWALWRSLLVLLAAVVLLWAARLTWPKRHLLGDVDRTTLYRWLRIAVAVAVICPLFYAVTRIAWVLGVPMGLDDAFLEQIQPIVMNGLGLALGAIGGAVLTIGLTQRWGEVFPLWLPVVGGRAVPVGFARNAALAVAFLIASAGAYFVRVMLTGGDISMAPEGAGEHWGAWLPEMLWPVWALALGFAALAYAERRRRGLPVGG